MRIFLILTHVFFLFLLFVAAKPRIHSPLILKNKERKFLELKLKKELSDKKLSPQKKYTLAILAARELKQFKYQTEALEFYRIARTIKANNNKSEIILAFSKNSHLHSSSIFFYDVNLESLIKNKHYEEAILSLNPDRLNEPVNAPYRIIYDLLNTKIRKKNVKKLYCFDEYQKNPDDYYQYSSVLCDLLVDYLQNGKLGNDHIKVAEEYFLKHDLKKIYLLHLAKELKK